ncbi:hypothetical protein JIY74_25490 [Vibrio harveyi]|nr:hypothetical protein [Vibrio harveyi]
MITALREFRNTNKINKSLVLEAKIVNTNDIHNQLFNKYNDQINNLLQTFINTKIIKDLDSDNKTSLSIDEYFLEISNDLFIDKQELITQLENKLDQLQKEINRSENMLNNPNFTSKAKPEKIQAEQEKYKSYKEQFNSIKTKLESLK